MSLTLISASEVVEFETDQKGPQANNVIINGNTAIVTAGSAPNERFEVSDALNISSIPVQIDLYDVSDVYRWKFSAFQIPSYNNLRFDTTELSAKKFSDEIFQAAPTE